MRVTVASTVVEPKHDGYDVTADFVTKYVAEVDDSAFVPGVLSWDKLHITEHAAEDGSTKILISADLVTEEVVTNDPNGYNGQEVSEDWIRSYITGADAYWLVPGALVPDEVTFA